MVGERCFVMVLQVLCAVYGAHGTTRNESDAPVSGTRSHGLERQANHDSDLETMTEDFPLGLPWDVTVNGTTRNVNKALPSSHKKDDSATTTDRRIAIEFSHEQIRVQEYDHNHSEPPATTHAFTIQAATLLPTITVTGANSRLTELTSMIQSTTKQATMLLSPTITAAMTKAATTPETTSMEPSITNTTTMAANIPETATMEPTITNTTTTTSTTPETTTMEQTITNTTTTTKTSTTPEITIVEPTITNTTAWTTPETTTMEPTIANTTTITSTVPETTTMEPTITNTTTTTTTSTIPETTTMEPTITNTTTTTTTSTTPETTTMEPTITNTTTTTTTSTTPEMTMEPKIMNTTTKTSTTMEPTITNTTTTTSTTPDTTTIEPTITNTTTTTMEPTITNTTTTTSTTPETTTIEPMITNTTTMKTTSEMTTTSLKTETTMERTTTERTTTSPATITSRPKLAKIQVVSSPPTTTSASYGIAFDGEQTIHPQPLPRRCPVTSTENTPQRRKKSAPYLADVEEDITEHDNKASSASPAPYDELRGGRHVEDATLFPEGVEDPTTEEDETEEELVKSTIQKLKALIEGKHRNETTKKRKENDAHLSSHFRFMTLTYLDKIRKIGKEKRITEPPTASTTASPKTEIIRGARPTEGMGSREDIESSDEESLSENASRSDNETHFSTLEEVKAEGSHESALTNSTTQATRPPEMHKLPTTSELKQKTNQNQTSEEPSDKDLYLDTRRYLEGVRARTRNRLPATRPPEMDEFPTTPELKPEIDQNQTSEEPSDRDLYLDTRRYLEGVRERTRNRLLGINKNLAPENTTTTTNNTTATTASAGTSIGASDSTIDLTFATYPIMPAMFHPSTSFSWDSLEFTTNISDSTTNPIISNASLAAAASTNTTSPSLAISSTNITTSPLQSLETTEFTNSTTSTSETFAGYSMHAVYPVLLSLDTSDTTANTTTKTQPFLTEETINTTISEASIVSESNNTTTTSPPSSPPPPLEIITTVPLTSTSEEPSLASKITTSLASSSPPPEVITTVSLPSTPEKPSLPMNTTTSGISTITLPSPSPPETRSTQTPMTNDTTPTETYTSNTTTSTTNSSIKHTSISSTNTTTNFTTPRSKATTAVPEYTIITTTPSQTVAGVNATVITADASIKEAASIIHRDMSKSTVILLGISLIGVMVLMTGGIILYRKRRQLQRWAPLQGRYTPRNWHQDV